MPVYQVSPLKAKFKSFLDTKFKEILPKLIAPPCFGIVLVGNDFASEKYIEMKLKMAQDLGIKTKFFKFDENVEKNQLETIFSNFVDNKGGLIGGLIFQLPIRADLKELVEQTPAQIDVDLLGLECFKLLKKEILPPTIGAIDLVLKDILGDLKLEPNTFENFIAQKLDLSGYNIAIVGQGVLVGLPLLEYLKNSGATIISVNEHTQNIKNLTKAADILISATGVGRLIDETWLKPTYTKNGVQFPILIDAGTSEGKLTKKAEIHDLDKNNGKDENTVKVLVGDVNTAKVQDICTLVAVPGGVGPITVRYIFWNLYRLLIQD